MTRHVFMRTGVTQLPGQHFLAVSYWSIVWRAFGVTQIIYLALAVLGLTLSTKPELYALYPASLAIVVIYMCDVLPYQGNVSSGNISYGLYVCRFSLSYNHLPLSRCLPDIPE